MLNSFLRIEGISGESSDDKHSGWIEIIDYDLDVGQNVIRTASSAGGGSAGRADFSVFSFAKLLDQATPLLCTACAAGTHFDNIVVELCRAGGEKAPFMRYEFKNCIICKVFTSSDLGFPADNVSFNYGTVNWAYIAYNRSKGYAAGQVATGWNLEKNCRA